MTIGGSNPIEGDSFELIFLSRPGEMDVFDGARAYYTYVLPA